jgi:RNA recognition motif-containing protein
MEAIDLLLQNLQRPDITVKEIDTSLDGFNLVDFISSLQSAGSSAEEAFVNGQIKVKLPSLEVFRLFSKFQTIVQNIITKDENKVLELNAKLRRKVKRLLENLNEIIAFNVSIFQPASPTAASSSAKGIKRKLPTSTAEVENLKQLEDEENSNKVILENSPLLLDKNLVTLIENVQKCTTALELEDTLTIIKSNNFGNTYSRRKLKRAIEQLSKKEEFEKTLNAKIRRRIQRVIKLLSTPPVPDDNSNKNEEGDESGSKKKKQKKETTPVKIPFILFVGQLPFSCTEDDLLAFLRFNEIQGDIKIRFLSDKQTKSFKGMGFIEVESYDEMIKCLLLHHSPFMNRKINIEKSGSKKGAAGATTSADTGAEAGAPGKEKVEKGMDKHQQQQRLIDNAFQKLFNEYKEKKVLDYTKLGKQFKEKLMSYSPKLLRDVLNDFEKVEKKERNFSKLDEIFSKLTNTSSSGATAVAHLHIKEEEQASEEMEGFEL